jgi:hypothetical protein|tara:strand:+ start:146 stop:448 length:303 start_codon:yes stop_codon:yes gene_type:complete
MLKKLIFIFILLFLNNCATPGSALLGPIFTGAKTGSIYQASISYSTGKIVNELLPSENFFQNNEKKNNEFTFNNNNPVIVSSYKVDRIYYSEVIEEEPLP